MRTFISSRKKEIVTILSAIKNKKYIDIYGYAGVGKTYLVEFIINNNIKIEGEKRIVYIKFNKIETLPEMLNLIALRIDDCGHPMFSNFINFCENKKYENSLIVNLFNANFRPVGNEEMLLIFDDTDSVADDVWDEFYKKILCFKYDESWLEIITIGRRKRRWAFFRLRDQTVPCKLENFTEENTREMVRGLAARHKFDIKKEKLAFETIFRLTIGHPESICIAVKHWTNNYSQPLDGEDIQSRYGEGITALLEQFIQVKILPPLSSALKEEEHYPSGETPLSLLQHLAPLRLLPLSILRQVLVVMFPDFYEIKNPTVHRELFRILYENIIIEGNKEKIYEMPEIVRNILIEDLRVNDHIKFRKINEKILSAYDTLIEHTIIRRHEYITEKIYHIILPATDVQERENSVRAAISEHVKLYDNTDMKKLQNMLQQDDWLSDKMNWKAFFKSL